MTDDWPQIAYEEAKAAYEAGQKLHKGGRTFLVRPALREQADVILWISDERTLGDHGLLLFPDGTAQRK